jgi:SLBB domain
LRLVDPAAPRLTRPDWLAVIFTAGLLSTLAFVTYARRSGPLPEEGRLHELFPKKEITVTIEGCVAHPGSYVLNPGARLKDLLALAQPLEQAKLDGLKSCLIDGQKIVISEVRFITVWVEGAVAHPRFYTLPEGARLGDLLRQVDLSDDAVTYKLKKREVLVDRQTVVIPHRQRARRAPSMLH